jgi:NADH-quinone oxidoreductase subunit N
MNAVASLSHSLSVGAPEVVLAAGTLLLLLVGIWQSDKGFRLLNLLALVLFALTAAVVVDGAGDRSIAWNGLYVADGLGLYLKLLVLGGAAAAVLMAMPVLEEQGVARFEYPVLIALATLGMCVMLSADTLLSFYIGLELMSLASYVLAAFYRGDARSSEAGLKYFVLGALSSGLLLYGMSLVYGFVGSVAFPAIAEAVSAGSERGLGLLIGMVFIFAGLGFKVSAVPFHMWTPDVYEGAPTPVAAFFASAPKVAAMGLFLRVAVEAFAGMAADWRQVVIFMAVASMLLGAIGAIGQNNIKRLLAYSSINNVGFMLIGVATATATGVTAVLFYLTVYMVMTLGAFLCVLALKDSAGKPVEDIGALGGLAHTRPWLALALATFMLSLAGLPPLFGFMPKLAVFNAAMAANLWSLGVIGVLSSVVAAYYYLRMVKILFFDDKAGLVEEAPVGGGAVVNRVMMAAAAAFCSPAGYLLLGPLASATQTAAASLF